MKATNTSAISRAILTAALVMAFAQLGIAKVKINSRGVHPSQPFYEKVAEWVQAIMQGINEGWIRPFVDKAFPVAQAGEAHSYIESRKNIGKVVLVP